MRFKACLTIIVFLFTMGYWGYSAAETIFTYRIINSYPHDHTAFTQGLVFDNGVLYEGTGLYNRSTLRMVALKSGVILRNHKLPNQYFGEGVTILNDEIIQLTWRSHVGFVYNKDTFAIKKRFHYPTEGWGITHDGKHLIMSDGTSYLYFLNPKNFQEITRICVRDRNGPVNYLNELEYVRGEIYANIWMTDTIIRLSPSTGKILGRIELQGLLQPADHMDPVDVLNGIAYDTARDRLFVTGKLWPKLFEISLVPLAHAK